MIYSLLKSKNIEVNVVAPKMDEVTGEWIKLHKEELNDLYLSPNIINVIKSRRIRLSGHVARMGG
jgi:GTP-binding protein EngB required for normal cell division